MIQASREHNGAYDSFSQTYRCYPLSHIQKSHLETGDKIIMPVSAFDRLISIRIDYPMLFQIENSTAGRLSHCGVLEFTGDEGLVFFPNWMMKNLQLNEGDDVKVKNANLRKGKYLKLQPHTTEFIQIGDPRAVLEATLRRFSCLSIGDTILIEHQSKAFYIDVVETKPDSAISVIETDCEVDFAPPLDYKEPEKPSPAPELVPKNVSPVKEEGKFKPFTGIARCLDGNPVRELAVPVMKEEQLAADAFAAGEKSKDCGLNFGLRKRPGKLVMGSDVIQPLKKSMAPAKNVPAKVQEETAKEEEEAKFKPFTGVARRLDEKPVNELDAAAAAAADADERSRAGPANFGSSRKRLAKLVVGFESNVMEPLKKLKKFTGKHTLTE